jgi:hypothetical protein
MAVVPAIPASEIVAVTPSVLAAGGIGLDLTAIFLTKNTEVPSGTVANFATQTDVATYFGSTSTEAAFAAIYFLGFNNSNMKPGNLAFAQYNTASIAGYLRGGRLGISVAQLQTLSGQLSVSVDSVLHSGTMNFSTVTSFSQAAQLIGTSLSLGTAGTTYDSIAGAFKIASPTTGANSSVSFASGTLAASLLLSQQTGAVVSPGAEALTTDMGNPIVFMDRIASKTQNWATFTTLWEPTDGDKISFAQWTNNQNNRYLYALWDTNSVNTGPAGPSSVVNTIIIGNYSGTALLYSNPVVDTLGGEIAPFLLGTVASIDFTETNGRITTAFKAQTGLLPQVTDATIAFYLKSYGLNFYGDYTTANEAFVWLYPGSVSGPFLWIDSYVNQIWLNSQLQLAEMVLLQSAKSIPYNTRGYGLIEASLLDPIFAAVNFGAIVPGVTLSQSQRAQVNSSSGLAIDTVISQRGWYLQVQDASPQVRQQRGSPPISLWYTDGQAVQQINISSVDIL